MKDNYRIILSSSEIITLGSMLNAESVIGIRKSDTRNIHAETETHIESVVSTLEEKKLIRYSFDGTLYINKVLKGIIQTMISPDKAAVISFTPKSGVKESFCILAKDSHYVKCAKRLTGGYMLSDIEELDARELLCEELFSAPQMSAFSVRLPLESAERAKRCIEAFDSDKATELISQFCDGNIIAEAIAEALSGNCSLLSVKLRVRNGRLYTTEYRTLTVVTSKGAITLTNDEDENIIFTAASSDITADIINLLRG